MSGIHLFVPMLHVRDAVGEHTRALRDLLVADGLASRIYTETPDPDTVEETRPYLDYAVDAMPGDVLVYQMATRSDMADWLVDRAEPVVVNYHSLTPPEYFAPWNNWIARHQARATMELRRLAPAAVLGIGVSQFDAAELRDSGCANVIDPGGQRPDPTGRARPCGDGGPAGEATGRSPLAVGGPSRPQQSPSGRHCRLVRGPCHHVTCRNADHHRLAL
jgi:hypothetical protein